MTDSPATVAGKSEEEVRAFVNEIVTDLAPNPDDAEITDDARLIEELGFHSLALLELAFTLEDEFDLPPIDEATAREITTVGTVATHVLTSLRERDEQSG